MTASGAATTAVPEGKRQGRTLGASLSGPDNALNTIRLILALLVIVAHTLPIAGAEGPVWLGKLGGWAVAGFFVISGYLITGSRLRSSWWTYSIRRIARIYPAYWVQLLAVAFIAAPAAVLLSPSQWSPWAALSYICQNFTTFGLQYVLDGSVFPHFDAWNGSAWTLMYELLAYAGCLILFAVPWCRRHVVLVSATALGALTAFNVAAPALDVTTNLYLHIGNLGAFFAAGMLAYGLRDRIVVSWPIIAGSAVVAVTLLAAPYGNEFAPVPAAYAVLAAGAASRTRIGATNDISYGVYIYAFPVQQLAAMSGLGVVAHLLFSTTVTVGVAWLSWRLVEQPAMNGAKTLIQWSRRRATG